MIISSATSFYSKRYLTHCFLNKLVDDMKNVFSRVYGLRSSKMWHSSKHDPTSHFLNQTSALVSSFLQNFSQKFRKNSSRRDATSFDD